MPSITIGIPFLQLRLSNRELQQLGNIVAQKLKQKDYAGYCQIVSKHSGKCLDVVDWSEKDGAKIQQYSLSGGANQQWFLVKMSGNCYYIFSRHSGKCLEVEGFQKEDGNNVQQYTFHGGDNQKWELQQGNNGYFSIIAKHSGKALDVTDWDSDDGVLIQQYAFHGDDNQRWSIQSI